jgi:hypothetical protein
LTRSNVQLADAGDYSVIVSNVVTAISSDLATLTITAPSLPHIDSIAMLPSGQAQLLVSGGPGTFTIEQAPYFTGWTQAFTTNVSGPVFQYLDPESNQPIRLYRAFRLSP